MKQLTIRAAVCSALLAFSGLASAKTINFTYEADKIIAAELEPFLTSLSTDPNPNPVDTYNNILTQMPTYQPSYRSDYVDAFDGLKRAVAFSELSNSEVSFTNTDIGFYKEVITENASSEPPIGTNYRYSQLASFGQNGFTADFSKPVTSVSMDFGLIDYNGTINENDWASYSPYSFPITSSTPTILNATYKDALGNTISNSTYTLGGNYNGFSLDNASTFSSIDISWDAGTFTVLQSGGKYESGFGPFERTYSNLLTANNFAYTQAVAVPEPETYAMMMAGLGMLGFTARRKKANQLLSKRS